MSKYKVNEKYFDEIDTVEKAYWIGYLYADGYVATQAPWSIILSSIDIEFLEKFKQCIDYTGVIAICSKSAAGGFVNSQQPYRLAVNRKELCLALNKLGLTSPNKSLPNIPEELQAAFLRGIFDGDGCICVSDKYCTTKGKRYGPYKTFYGNIILHKDHIKEIQALFDKLGIHTSIQDSKTEYMKYLRWSSNSASKALADFIYSDDGPRLKRKEDIFKSIAP